jgi:DNA-binding transcriptional MocR family regulator
MALAEFLNRQEADSVTERLNEVYSHRDARVDSLLHRAQLSSIEKERW